MSETKSFGEEILLNCLSVLFSEEIRNISGMGRANIMTNTRPDFMGGLEFDFYLPEQHLAFEYQGSQHYTVGFGTGKNGFKKRILYDAIKRVKAWENNIVLVDVAPYCLDSMENFCVRILDRIRIHLVTKQLGRNHYEIDFSQNGTKRYVAKQDIFISSIEEVKGTRISFLHFRNTKQETENTEFINLMRHLKICKIALNKKNIERPVSFNLSNELVLEYYKLLETQSKYLNSVPATRFFNNHFQDFKYHSLAVNLCLKEIGCSPKNISSIERKNIFW